MAYRNPFARWLGSPNEWAGREGHSAAFTGPNAGGASFYVMHITDCTEVAATNRFEDPNAQVSAHYQVPKAAELDCSDPDPRKWHPVPGCFDQYVDEADAAWGSGNGDMNDNSTQTEHERLQSDLDNHEPYPAGQLLVAMWLCKDVCLRNGLPIEREWCCGHTECTDREGVFYGFGRGRTATGCPDDWPTDLVVQGAAMLANGQDPRPLVGVPSTQPQPAPAPTSTVVPANPVPGTVYDTPDNDRTFYDYNTFAPVPGSDEGTAFKVAATGQAVRWDRARQVTVNGASQWLDGIHESTWALLDGCVDDGGYDPPHFAPPPAAPAPTPQPAPEPQHKRNPAGDPNDPAEDNNADILPGG